MHSKGQRYLDRHLYKERRQTGILFNKLKQYRRIATRYDKTASSSLGSTCFCRQYALA